MHPAPFVEDFEKAYDRAVEKEVVCENGTTQNFCLVPKCIECDAPMKFHCMCFDENYSEHYYRKETVMNFINECDCLIVVGTALATSLAKEIVTAVLEKELPVIEVNLETSIGVGNNIQVLSKSEIALPALFEEYYRLIAARPKVKATGVTKGKKGARKSMNSKKPAF